MRAINEAGLTIIKTFESFQPSLYVCPSGYWTVGYGHVVHSKATNKMLKASVSGSRAEAYAQFPKPITIEEASELLQNDIKKFCTQLESFLPPSLNENQFSSLVSFAFNIGVVGLKLSTLNKLLQRGEFEKASHEFNKWVFGTVNKVKVVLPGLAKRREAEKTLFLKPV